MISFIARWIGLIGVGIAAFFVGVQYERQTTSRTATAAIKEVEKTVVKTVLIRETKPNGKIIESIVTDRIEDKSKNTTLPSMAAPRNLPKWSVGIKWAYGNYTPVGVELGRAMIGNIWLTTEANWDYQPHLLVGIRYEF